MSTIYQSLIPLMAKKSAITDPKKFQELVNVIFHDFEAAHYDDLHREMWESLPQQYELLANDILACLPQGRALKLLDIGCGTGLATELLLKTGVGAAVSEVHLLDTSVNMLSEALKRSKGWKRKVKTIQGFVSDVEGPYDVIIISSVLHHIPDLVAFLAEVAAVQAPGGLLLTIHDPNSDSLDSADYLRRTSEYEGHKKEGVFSKAAFGKRVGHKLRRMLKIPTYIDRINKKLLAKDVITESLDESELWSITDIHVENLPYSAGRGIAKDLLVNSLEQYRLLSYRTYAFFGYLYSNLDETYKQKEIDLTKLNDLHGRNFCSAWIKHTAN